MKRTDSTAIDHTRQQIIPLSEGTDLGCCMNHIHLRVPCPRAPDQENSLPSGWIHGIRPAASLDTPALPAYLTNRTAEFAARRLLRDQGFRVIRVTDRHNVDEIPFHLIAWNDHSPLLCIRVRSPRKDLQVQDELKRLATRAIEHPFPGELQYWINAAESWHRYRIYPGGAMQIPDVHHG